MRATSNWGRHRLQVSAGVIDKRYPAQNEQSISSWNAGIDGMIELGRHQLVLDYNHLASAQTPRDLGTPQLSTPAPYTLDAFQAGVTLNGGRVSLTPSLEFGMWRYADTVPLGTTEPLNYQNRNVITGNLLARFQASSNRSLIMVLRGISTDYVAPIAGQPSRDSNGVELLVGMEYASGAIWRYRVLAGYQNRNYVSRAIRDASGPTVEAAAIWQPTGLTSVTGQLLHTIADSSLQAASSYTLTIGRLTVDHELRRNVLVQGRAEIGSAAYPQNLGSATIYGAGASVSWLMNRRLRLVLSSDFTRRDSGPSSFSQNITLVRLGFGL